VVATGGTGGQVSTSTTTCASPTQGDVAISAPSGTFQGTLSVQLTTSIANAEIRYTTNGTAPTSSSTLYSGTALSLTHTTRLRAQAFVQGSASGTASSALFSIVSNGTDIRAAHATPSALVSSIDHCDSQPRKVENRARPTGPVFTVSGLPR